MATQTTITAKGIKYTLALIYFPKTQNYAVLFSSQNRRFQHAETREFPTYSQAWKNYSNNYLYHTGHRPSVITEDQFHGLAEGTLSARSLAQQEVAI